MSTILNALQKQAANQTYNMPYTRSDRRWKVALGIASLIILILLTLLSFLLLKQQGARSPETVLQTVPEQQSLPSEKPEQKRQLQSKQISKVFFTTKRLPVAANKATAEQAEITSLDNSEKQATALSGSTKQQEIDYSNVSAELQQRFQQALLRTKTQGKVFVENENSDGSDLHLMAEGFQARVPSFTYDLHIYSSVAKDRWIRINNEDLREGQFDSSGKIQVVEIQPNRTIFRFDKQSFSLPSLTDWLGK
ncbi:MAG: general secretion pathway protein GspB [Psychromonas sp.]|nr:general secretion pathway protein GspB [Psychromonas sp.]